MWQASGDVPDVASVRRAGDVATGDVTGATWATSHPFHVYSRTWDWYPGRGRTPEKRGDVSDLKKEDLLPVHFFFQITGIVRDHCSTMVSKNLAVDFDHNFDDKKKTFLTWCPVQGLVLRSLRRLAPRADGCRPCREKEDTTTTTTTTPFLQSPPAALRQGIAQIVFSRPPGLQEGRRGVLLVFLDSTFGLDRRHPTSHSHFHFALRILARFTQGGGGGL
jgi:hypothetical protein